MDSDNSSKHVVLMAFGLPVMTTGIVIGSMYIGHLITTQSDRPTKIDFNVPSAPAPRIDVNVPTAAPPTVEVTTPAPKVDVHVPQGPPPTVTVNTPAAAAPNITVNPAAPTVTIIDRRQIDPEKAEKASAEKAAAPAAAVVAPPEAPAPAFAKPVEPARATPGAAGSSMVPADGAKPPAARTDKPAKPTVSEEEPTLETLYSCATRYIDAYCRKHSLDPAVEGRKWNVTWRRGLEQAMADNIDSGEQSYINRVVITKRDYFDLEKATPEKIVEACRIILRYRDGQLAWLQAMKDSMTQENLKKTVAFLAAGP